MNNFRTIKNVLKMSVNHTINLKQSSAKLSWILSELQEKQQDFVSIVCKVSIIKILIWRILHHKGSTP